MLRRRFIQSILAVIGLASTPYAIGTSVARRAIPIQTSPIAGFQYHNGEAVWGWLCPGQALDLVRERDNPYDKKAVRVDWLGHKLGYVPRIENPAVAQLLDRGEKLSARIVALNDRRDARWWEWDWERGWFEILLEA